VVKRGWSGEAELILLIGLTKQPPYAGTNRHEHTSAHVFVKIIKRNNTLTVGTQVAITVEQPQALRTLGA
jgi:hypothetical protein